MYPHGTIERGYICPVHPIPAIILFVLTIATLVGMYFGYWINILGGLLFYSLASVWFVSYRYKSVDLEHFIKPRWPRPKGY